MQICETKRFMDAVASRGPAIETLFREERDAATGATTTGEVWPLFGSNLSSYADDFRRVVTPATKVNFLQLIDSLGNNRPGRAALDIGADTTVVEELVEKHGFTKGVAVSVAYSSTQTKPNPNVIQLNGDVLPTEHAPSVFSTLRDFLNELGLQGFRLIFERAEGGLLNITNDPIVQFWLLNEIWKIMDPSGSTAFISLPIFCNSRPTSRNSTYQPFTRDNPAFDRLVRRLIKFGIQFQLPEDDDIHTPIPIRIDRGLQDPTSLYELI